MVSRVGAGERQERIGLDAVVGKAGIVDRIGPFVVEGSPAPVKAAVRRIVLADRHGPGVERVTLFEVDVELPGLVVGQKQVAGAARTAIDADGDGDGVVIGEKLDLLDDGRLRNVAPVAGIEPVQGLDAEPILPVRRSALRGDGEDGTAGIGIGEIGGPDIRRSSVPDPRIPGAGIVFHPNVRIGEIRLLPIRIRTGEKGQERPQPNRRGSADVDAGINREDALRRLFKIRRVRINARRHAQTDGENGQNLSHQKS